MDFKGLTTGERIYELLKMNNLNAEQLVNDLKNRGVQISKATLSDIMNDIDKGYNYKFFVEIAKYFHVSTDFLFCLSPIPTNDKTISDICKYTGLSSGSVRKLNKYVSSEGYEEVHYSSIFDFIDRVILSDNLTDNVRYLYSALHNVKEVYTEASQYYLLLIQHPDDESLIFESNKLYKGDKELTKPVVLDGAHSGLFYDNLLSCYENLELCFYKVEKQIRNILTNLDKDINSQPYNEALELSIQWDDIASKIYQKDITSNQDYFKKIGGVYNA